MPVQQITSEQTPHRISKPFDSLSPSPEGPSGIYHTLTMGSCDTKLPRMMDSPQQQSPVQLDVIVVGAGISGLATAISTALSGHKVTVFESAKELLEV